MIELAAGQGNDGHAQAGQFGVGRGGMGSQGAAERAVEVVFDGRVALGRSPAEQFDGPVAEYPNTDVHQEKVCRSEFGQPGSRGFLQHIVERAGRAAVHEEHTVVLCQRGFCPQPVADYVGLRQVVDFAGRTQQYVTACDEGVKAQRRFFENAFVERDLEGKERLVELLAASPAENGNGGEYLAAWSVGRQTPALTAGMEDDSFFCG